MQSVFQDLRYALRQLIASPGFSLTSVVSLALGIGATTAVFSVVYAALINPFPFRDAGRIMRLGVRDKTGGGHLVNLNGPQIERLRQSPAVDSVIAMDTWSMALTGPELPEEVAAIQLSSNGFDFLGMPAMLGRGIQPSDAIEGQSPQPVAVLGNKFWRRHYNSDPSVVGKTVQLDHKDYLIVGVAAPRFVWYSADLYVPLNLTRDPVPIYIVDFRLKPGEARSTANALLQPLLEEFAKETPKHLPEQFKTDVQGLNDWVVRQMGRTLHLLLGAVGLLLAIGCGNVSILLMARGTARQHELAVRSAIGAARARIVRQLLTESLLLSITGAALGVGTAFAMLAGIRAVLPRYEFAPEVQIAINLPVLEFSVIVALVTGVLFGLWPALQLSRPAMAQMMQSNTRRLAGSVHGRKTHNLLIAGQIALTLLLLAGAGTAMQSFARLIHAPLGYDPHNVMAVPIPLHEGSYTIWAARANYLEQLRAKVAETPGVANAAISFNATPPQNGSNARFEIQGRPSIEQPSTLLNYVSPEYFTALRIPLLQGRVWTPDENRIAGPVAVINRAMAEEFFPNGDAIGHAIRLPEFENRPPIVLSAPGVANQWFQIVGIVADHRNRGLRDPIRPEAFIPWTACMWEWTRILVRSDAPPLTLLQAIRKQLAAVNADQQTSSEADDLEQWIADEPAWQQDHLIAWIFGAFSVLALALAAVGLYSVVSYTVTQRTGEFGIRMALGAQRSHVLGLVFSSMLVTVGSGIGAGLAFTLALHRVLASTAESTGNSPFILLAAAAVLVLVAAVSCAIPARRASRVEPMTALRYE